MKKKIISAVLCAAMVATGLLGSVSLVSAKEDKVKLRFMGYNTEKSRETYLKYLAEKLPNIEIEFEFVDANNFDNILNTQLQAGEGPDIIELGGQTRLLSKAGYLLDLSDKEFVKKYSDAGITPYTVDSKVYATPLQSWFEGIFYNKKIFKDNGIEVPKTWEDFIKIHKTLEEKGIKAETMGAQSWEPMMKQSIGLVNNMFYSTPESKGFDERFNEGKASLAEAWLPAVKEWSKTIEAKDLTPEMLGLSYDQALDEFATEKAAMWESGPWAEKALQEKNKDLDFGMFPIPGMDANKPGWLVGGPGSALGINAKSKHIEEALKVLEETATPEAQKALVKDNPGSSFLKGVEVDLGPIYADCSDTFKEGNVYAPWTSVWTNGNAVVEAYGKSLQEVLAGKKTVEEALQDADKTNTDLLETLK